MVITCGVAIALWVAMGGGSFGAPNARIISLAPSLTEIAYAIGCGPQLVADTSYDDYPAAARSLPHVADLAQADLERIAVLRPTTVVALRDQEREGQPITAQLGIPVVYLPNRRLSDLNADISGVGSACARPRAARSLIRSLQARLRQTASGITSKTHPRVLFLLDLPGFTAGAGTFLDDLVHLAGGVNVAGSLRQPYPNVSAEWLLSANPDVLIVSKGTPFGPDIRAREPWRSLKAVQQMKVYQPTSDDILQRNGPRIVDGLRWLVKAIHSQGK